MALEPASPKVQQLIRDKMQHVLDVCSSGGFGYRQAALLRLKEIEVTGVDLVGPDDTVSWVWGAVGGKELTRFKCVGTHARSYGEGYCGARGR